MKNITKLGATAAAIGALGVAGSFGTFSAFTDAQTKDVAVTSGTLKVTNDFQLPKFENLGTRETTYTCDKDTGLPGGTGASECAAGDAGKSAGHITVTNTGSLPQDVYIDFDGPAATDVSSPNAENSNVLASNIIMDSSNDANFTTLGWVATRLFKFNNSGPLPYIQNLEPGHSQTVYFRAWLRERQAGVYALGDNEMQNKSITGEKITVTGIETGHSDISMAPDGGN